ncbi:hypothetical protein BC938DRAFT_480638 [Jimgerdemannia flammicorona]|uniref:Uncharacterized protein n=1 Tax=Jimgerdemannia flammicorona TaxID=994334 RepID=A0A433QI37_9FUNG|nr:hypothetical protein BC938DRAFT_480638 [Jimgerdemannia flammicorona]
MSGQETCHPSTDDTNVHWEKFWGVLHLRLSCIDHGHDGNDHTYTTAGTQVDVARTVLTALAILRMAPLRVLVKPGSGTEAAMRDKFKNHDCD